MTRDGLARAAMAAFGLSGLLVAVAQAQTPPPPVPREPAMVRTISVTGVGKVNLTPDRASFTAGVQTMAPTVAAATQQNAATIAAVMAALRQAGATDKELRTSTLAISPQQSYQEGRAWSGQTAGK